MTYVDAEDMTYQNGSFDKSLFRRDKIHLTPEAGCAGLRNTLFRLLRPR